MLIAFSLTMMEIIRTKRSKVPLKEFSARIYGKQHSLLIYLFLYS